MNRDRDRSRGLRSTPITTRLQLAISLASAGTLLLAALGFLARAAEESRFGLFIVAACLLALLGAGAFAMLLPVFRTRGVPEPVPLKLSSDPRSVAGYDEQFADFARIIEAANAEYAKESSRPQIIALFGKSGVGKSSFVERFFLDNRSQYDHLRLDLRLGRSRLKRHIVAWSLGVDASMEDKRLDTVAGDKQPLDRWVQTCLEQESLRDRLSGTVLVLDQFEQVLASRDAHTNAAILLSALGNLCRATIVCVRSDVLGRTLRRIREVLKDALKLFRNVRLFDLMPVPHRSSAERELLGAVWCRVMETPDASDDLIEALAGKLYEAAADDCTLPVFAIIAIHALKEAGLTEKSKVASLRGDVVRGLIAKLFERILVRTGDSLSSMKMVFALANEHGVARGFEVAQLQTICGIRASDGNGAKPEEDRDLWQHLADLLEKLHRGGVVCEVAVEKYTLSHEQIGPLAETYAQSCLSLPERNQIRKRQKLVDSDRPLPKLLDAKDRFCLWSLEGGGGLVSILFLVFRLCVWRPRGMLGFDQAFIPAAIANLGFVFWVSRFYGNLGKAIAPYQGVPGKVLVWPIARVAPVIAALLSARWAGWWLSIAAGLLLYFMLCHVNNAIWSAEHGCADLVRRFRRYAFSGFYLAILAAFTNVVILELRSSGSDYAYAIELFGAVCVFFMLTLFAIVWWSGPHLREILAQVDTDILPKTRGRA